VPQGCTRAAAKENGKPLSVILQNQKCRKRNHLPKQEMNEPICFTQISQLFLEMFKILHL
jgi:hypothetical protein